MDNSRAIICDAYLVLLGRQPWETEITYWRDFFRAGGSMADLYEEILSSYEGQLMQKRTQRPQAPKLLPCTSPTARGKAENAQPWPGASRSDRIEAWEKSPTTI